MSENKIVDSVQNPTQAAEVTRDPIGYLVVSRSGVIDEARIVGPSHPVIDATKFVRRPPGEVSLMVMNAIIKQRR